MAITNKASALPNEECVPKSQKHTFQGLLYDRLFEKYGCHRDSSVTSRVSILTSNRWGGGANDCTSTEGIHGKTAASPSE